MAAQSSMFIPPPTTEPPRFPSTITFNSRSRAAGFHNSFKLTTNRRNFVQLSAVGDSKGKAGSGVPSPNYVVPLDNYSSGITRPLAEILRDLNKRIPDNIITKEVDDTPSSFIPWYHANRMLSFYAPGWCGEIRDVIFSDTGSVTVVYRVTVRGSDGEAHRESSGTVSSAANDQGCDPVAAAEEIAFGKACARFGLGLYLYHED